MSTTRPVLEEDLQGYIDGLADLEQRRVVESYLSAHPAFADRISVSMRQRELLREALAPIAEEPIPPNLNVVRLGARHLRPRSMPAWRSATATGLLCFGLAAGWFAKGAVDPPPRGVGAVAREAADSYRVYAEDVEHPVEIAAAQRGALVNWVSTRLGRPVLAPDLTGSGFVLLGGRVVATAHGPAGFFLYQDGQAGKLVVYVRPMEIRDKTTKMTDHVFGALDDVAWAVDGLGYGVVSTDASAKVRFIADKVRKQAIAGRL